MYILPVLCIVRHKSMLIVDSTVGTNYIFCIDRKKLITVAGLRQLGPSINNTQDRPAVSNNNKLMNRRLYIGGKDGARSIKLLFLLLC